MASKKPKKKKAAAKKAAAQNSPSANATDVPEDLCVDGYVVTNHQSRNINGKRRGKRHGIPVFTGRVSKEGRRIRGCKYIDFEESLHVTTDDYARLLQSKAFMIEVEAGNLSVAPASDNYAQAAVEDTKTDEHPVGDTGGD